MEKMLQLTGHGHETLLWGLGDSWGYNFNKHDTTYNSLVGRQWAFRDRRDVFFAAFGAHNCMC